MITLSLLLALLIGGKEDGVFPDWQSRENLNESPIEYLLPTLVNFYNQHSSEPFKYVAFDANETLVTDSHGFKYIFNVLLAPSTCAKYSVGYVSLANLGRCKLREYEFRRCIFSLSYRQGLLFDDSSLSLEDCMPATPKMPENPQYLGFKLPENVDELYANFKWSYKKQYQGTENEIRFNIFKANLLKAQLYQVLERGSAVYGITPFSDLTSEEFAHTHLMASWDSPLKSSERISLTGKVEDIPDNFDWREKGAVTDIKDQGMCGSCWAFSTTGNIEGQWFRKTGKLLSLSEQQLVDCDKLDDGCGGGLPLNAYESIIRMGGLMTEDTYPYDAKDEKCHLKISNIAAYINSSVSLPEDENQLAIWLYQNSTISVGMNAMLLQFYRHGISHPWKIFCSKYMLDHAVLLVGYGVSEENIPYWIVKNSWGVEWGEKGYFRMYRGDGTCGINTVATSAVIY